MANERTLDQVEAEIAQVKNELNDVHGTPTEVYARIVGYYRAVRNWNKGKADEFTHRKMFTLEDSNRFDSETLVNSAKETKKETSVKTAAVTDEIASYDIFVRKTCPNCPPVKAFMAGVELPGRNIDVDTDEGLNEAASKGVFAAPTVIFYNNAGVETARCHNVEELEAVLNKVAVTA